MVREKDGQRKMRKDGGRGNFEDEDPELIAKRNAGLDEDAEANAWTKKALWDAEVDVGEDSDDDEDDQDLWDEVGAKLKIKGTDGYSPWKRSGGGKDEAAEDDEDDEEQKAADMWRLEEVRRRREEDKKKREEKEAKKKAEEEAKAKAAAEKAAADKEKYNELAAALLKLVEESADKKLSINTLNQDAKCKKVLKPLVKKAGVKTLNKKSLEEITASGGGKVKVTEVDNLVWISF